MITTYINSNYRITYEGVSMVENALGNPNLVQISVTSGCTIVVPGSDENKKFGIDYLPNGEARSWKLNGLNTRINKKEAHFIYARLGRNEESALLVFSTNDYRIDGSVVSGETEIMPASDSFFYIKVGSITATDAVGESATLDREITYDGGYYRTDNYNDTTGGSLGDMFTLTADGLINALKEFASFTVRGTLSVIGKIVLNEKQITGVAREMDDSPVIDDETVPTTAYLNGKYLIELAKKFLRKDADDRTPFKLNVGDKLTAEKGVQISKNFVSGIIGGSGGAIRIDENGKVIIETDKAVFREELIVPKITFNCIDVISGDKANTFSYGTIKSVDKVNHTATLDLLEDQWGTLHVDDICRGIFHNIEGANHTQDTYGDNGFMEYSGFATSYFTPVRIIKSEAGTMIFEYALQAGTTVHPMIGMNFFAYGNFTDKDRQAITYENRYYTRRLAYVNTWVIDPEKNIMMQTGDLSGLSIGGIDFSGYSFYGKNVYISGTIERLKPNGTPVKELSYEGEWDSGRQYDYYDSVTHNGSTWACINKNGSSSEPGTNNDWQKIASKGDTGEPGPAGADGESVTSLGRWQSGMIVPSLGIVTMGGNTYIAKVQTTNPPLWCVTDSNGNRLLQTQDGTNYGYVLTGEANTDEYDLLVQSGKDGSDGTDYEFIFKNTVTDQRPATPSSSQTDDYVPSGWNDDPVGVSPTLPYEWVSKREKKDGVWGNFSTPEQWANYSFNAIVADLDNQMDNVALDESGKTIAAASIVTTAAMWSGSTKLTLSSISVQSVTGITSSYDLSTGAITLSVAKGTSLPDRTGITITIKATAEGAEKTRALKFTLAGVRGGKNAVLYSIVTSASSIVKKKDGSYSASGVSATRMKTVGGVSQATTDGTLKYSIDGGAETVIGNGVSVPSSSISSKVTFSFYDASGVLVDVESVPMIQDGVDGQGYTQMGRWHSGMIVPKLGVVTMAGSSYVAKVQTTNPPLWCVTDSNGNRLLQTQDGVNYGYVLTGETNTAEYDLLASRGDDGEKGDKGDQGDKGDKGEQGQQGIQGCIIRHSEWALGVTYHNDEALTSGTRYLDIAMLKNNAAIDGWDVYVCNSTHTSSEGNKPGTASAPWTKLSGVGPIYTSLIIAKNASIDFMQGNQLLIKKDDGTVTAGLSGSIAGSKVRIWAGSSTPDNAPFRVLESGKMIGTDVELTGTINAISGKIGGFSISGNGLTNNNGDDTFTNDAYIIFRNDAHNCFAGIGGNVLPASSGARGVARFENYDESDWWGLGTNYALLVGARGVSDNVAINISGGHITSFAVRNEIVSESKTINRASCSVACLNTDEITITLPTMEIYDDGREICIKNLNGGVVNIKPGSSYHYVNGVRTLKSSFISSGRGEHKTNASPDLLKSIGDAATYRYFRDITKESEQGAWVQFKNPRDW